MSSKLAALAILALASASAAAPVGLYGRWGVFRDGASCHAVTHDAGGEAWLAVIGGRTVAAGLRGGAATTLGIGRRQLPLTAGRLTGGAAARAIALLRERRSATVAGVADGRRVRRAIALAEAGTAIDAAVVACAR